MIDYSIPESGPPKFRPGEKLAASGFVALIFFLVLENNIGIYRVFKKKQGLYYWSMLLGNLGCALNCIGIVVEYLIPFNSRLWELHLAFLLVGWSIYAPAQLLVLYSRLHLVNRSRVVQRGVLIMIVSSIFVFVIPSWVVDWPAWNPEPKDTSVWSPREGIVDRYTQLGFTVFECVLSGVYAWSLLRLLKVKSSVRQRRVMLDLIYVNIIGVCLDIIVVVLVFTNQLGVSHPIQDFSYILKLKLEFLVLNQLMAIAARGIRRDTFAERRYHYQLPSIPISSGQSDEKSSGVLSTPESVRMPQPAHAKSRPLVPRLSDEIPTESKDLNAEFSHHETAEQNVGPAPGQLHSSTPLRTSGRSRTPTLQLPHHPFNHHDQKDYRSKGTMNAKIKVPSRKEGSHGGSADEDEDEIGIHCWENRGNLILEVPWFRKPDSNA